MKNAKQYAYEVQVRFMGEWIPQVQRATKELAEDYADKSSACQREGYQIKKVPMCDDLYL